MSSELHSLRDEVSQLRGELVEKVGGQLRLERVETTRVIGSNIEALQHEVRRLAVGRDDLGLGSLTRQRPIEIHEAAPEPAPAPVVAPVVARVVAEVVAPVDVAPPVAAPTPPAPVAPGVQAPPPIAAVAQAPPPNAPAVAPAPEPARAASTFESDPFAGLPRLSRFTDDDASSETRELPTVTESRVQSRHAADDQGESGGSRRAGGRRRRDDDEPNDILERLLSSRP